MAASSSGSLGYCERLSYREDLGGTLGDPELHDAEDDVLAKSQALADAVGSAAHLVVFTGAGISTSAGIPDFRGPNGLWTRQRRGEVLPKASMPFEQACPSLTHQALLALLREGRLKYLVSQNVDSLHLRSGFPRELLAELHGNCFAERCGRCAIEYVRDFEVGSVGFKPTGRVCERCGEPLVDQCLDWDNALPEDELMLAEQHAAKADLALCLGTSLIVTPARDIPARALYKRKHKPRGGRLAIVNLQGTPLDRRAAFVLHAPVDHVMASVMARLRLPIPPYCRRDSVVISHETRLAPTPSSSEASGGASRHAIRLRLRSIHGADCPLPWLRACEISLPPPLGARAMCAPEWTVDLPIELTPALIRHRRLTWRLTLLLAEGTNAPSTIIHYAVEFTSDGRLCAGERRYEIITSRVEYAIEPDESNSPPLKRQRLGRGL